MNVCPKCSGEMSNGVVCSNSPLKAGESQSAKWVRGEIVLVNGMSVIKADGRGPKDVKAVAALRCEQCGFLEVYAP